MNKLWFIYSHRRTAKAVNLKQKQLCFHDAHMCKHYCAGVLMFEGDHPDGTFVSSLFSIDPLNGDYNLAAWRKRRSWSHLLRKIYING